MKNDEIYVVNQPKHSILSVILFDEEKTKFPLSDNLHENIFKLAEISDLFFVFKGKYYENTADLDKFTSLYGATAWINTISLVTPALMKVLQYARDIFNQHTAYTICNSFNLDEIKDINQYKDKIMKVTMSDTTWPILKITRLNSFEMYDIYMRENVNKNWLENWYNEFWNNIKNPRNNKYTTFKSESNIIYLKNITINKIVELWENEGGYWHEWINTFTWNDPRYLIASLLKLNDIKTQNINIEDLTL